MSSRSLRLTLALACGLLSPILAFAGGQPAKLRMFSQAEIQDRLHIARAIQQGKGAGLSRAQVFLPAKDYRAKSSSETVASKVHFFGVSPAFDDPAFHR